MDWVEMRALNLCTTLSEYYILHVYSELYRSYIMIITKIQFKLHEMKSEIMKHYQFSSIHNITACHQR